MGKKLKYFLGILFILACGVSFADVPYVIVPPQVEYTIASSGCAGGACEYFEWERKIGGGAWATFAEGTSLSIRDKLAAGVSARYRVRAFVQGWACDEDGCRPYGERLYGEWSEPSDWVISFDPSPGACGKPRKQ